ncbi:MAG: hypothetical protein ABJF10_04265 [Chthoniobacter sp.]
MRKLSVVLTYLAAHCWCLSARAEVKADEAVACDLAFRRPGFSTVEDFVDAVQSRGAPWDNLLTPKVDPQFDNPDDFHAALTDHVKVIHRARNFAIVFADNKPGRVSPFCAVVFLLERKERRFHVADFIRRSARYQSYSYIGDPQPVKLRPSGLYHFYFTEYLGGRKWGFDSEEFYVVSGGRFHRTLVLKNVGAYLSPADPYREFTQDVQVSVRQGRPRIAIHRIWTEEGKEDREQSIATVCTWNSQSLRFIGPKVRGFSLKEPEVWSGKGLPKPPAN